MVMMKAARAVTELPGFGEGLFYHSGYDSFPGGKVCWTLSPIGQYLTSAPRPAQKQHNWLN